MSKTVAAFTGNRAEYGLLYPILKAIHAHPDMTLQLYVGGDHTRLGTIAEIERDELPIFQVFKYDAPMSDLDPASLMARATADLLPKMQQAFLRTPPDIFLVLGDRYESFAATLAAFYCQTPIAHLGGGDITEGGCVDDTLRFLMSQLAHMHFVISQNSANCLIQRGEEPWRIHVTGSPVIDNLVDTPILDKQFLCTQYKLDPSLPIVLFTQHPIPAEGAATVEHFADSVLALAALGDTHRIQVLATRPNQDGFGEAFEQVIAHSREHHTNMRWVDSLGRSHYLSWLANCDVVVGNSSSGLIETPFFRIPSVTVGPRQKGRLRADNVLEVSYGVESVKPAVLRALKDQAFLKQVQTCQNPFGSEPCGPKICEFLLSAPPRKELLAKKFMSQEQASKQKTDILRDLRQLPPAGCQT